MLCVTWCQNLNPCTCTGNFRYVFVSILLKTINEIARAGARIEVLAPTKISIKWLIVVGERSLASLCGVLTSRRPTATAWRAFYLPFLGRIPLSLSLSLSLSLFRWAGCASRGEWGGIAPCVPFPLCVCVCVSVQQCRATCAVLSFAARPVMASPVPRCSMRLGSCSLLSCAPWRSLRRRIAPHALSLRFSPRSHGIAPHPTFRFCTRCLTFKSLTSKIVTRLRSRCWAT